MNVRALIALVVIFLASSVHAEVDSSGPATAPAPAATLPDPTAPSAHHEKSTASSDGIDAVAPGDACERFLGEARRDCQRLLRQIPNDSYLTVVCQKQFDDDLFKTCLRLTEVYDFDPKKIQPCAADTLEDDSRLNCLRTVGKPWPDNGRSPASLKKKNHRLRKK